MEIILSIYLVCVMLVKSYQVRTSAQYMFLRCDYIQKYVKNILNHMVTALEGMCMCSHGMNWFGHLGGTEGIGRRTILPRSPTQRRRKNDETNEQTNKKPGGYGME